MNALARAYRLGAESRSKTIAAWLRTLADWNVSLDRAAEMIEAGVPWSDSEQPVCSHRPVAWLATDSGMICSRCGEVVDAMPNEERFEYRHGFGPGDGGAGLPDGTEWPK